MAVPKKRTGKSAQAKRRANWKGTVPATTTCKNCGSVVLTHTVCPECGTYKGKVVSIKGQSAPAEVKEEKKETKKAAKKAEASEVIEVKSEDIKEEAVEEKPKRTRKKKTETAEAQTKEEDK